MITSAILFSFIVRYPRAVYLISVSNTSIESDGNWVVSELIVFSKSLACKSVWCLSTPDSSFKPNCLRSSIKFKVGSTTAYLTGEGDGMTSYWPNRFESSSASSIRRGWAFSGMIWVAISFKTSIEADLLSKKKSTLWLIHLRVMDITFTQASILSFELSSLINQIS